MIIGLCGFKGSGKTLVANHISNVYGFTKHNFKDALIDEVVEKFPDLLELLREGWNQPTVYDLFITKPPYVRALLQNYGTNVRRAESPDYWVNKWRQSLPDGNVVVDDVRFLNEAEAIHAKDGLIIRIVRSDIKDGGSHISETEHLQIDHDCVISADTGNKEFLLRSVDDFIRMLKVNVD